MKLPKSFLVQARKKTHCPVCKKAGAILWENGRKVRRCLLCGAATHYLTEQRVA